MAVFESYERRIKQIHEALNSYGIASIEEAGAFGTEDAAAFAMRKIKERGGI